MAAYDDLMEWFWDCCMAWQEEPRKEEFEMLLKDYEKEIREDERKTKSNCTDSQDSTGASLSDT